MVPTQFCRIDRGVGEKSGVFESFAIFFFCFFALDFFNKNIRRKKRRERSHFTSPSCSYSGVFANRGQTGQKVGVF